MSLSYFLGGFESVLGYLLYDSNNRYAAVLQQPIYLPLDCAMQARCEKVNVLFLLEQKESLFSVQVALTWFEQLLKQPEEPSSQYTAKCLTLLTKQALGRKEQIGDFHNYWLCLACCLKQIVSSAALEQLNRSIRTQFHWRAVSQAVT